MNIFLRKFVKRRKKKTKTVQPDRGSCLMCLVFFLVVRPVTAEADIRADNKSHVATHLFSYLSPKAERTKSALTDG